MRQTSFRKFAIATSTFAIAAMFSFSWSEQSGVSLSVDNAQAQTHAPFVPHKGPGGRLYVTRNPNPYTGDLSGLLGTQCGRTTLVAPGAGSPAARTARPLGSLGVNPTPATAAGITISRSTALVATPGHRSGAATASSMFASKRRPGGGPRGRLSQLENLKPSFAPVLTVRHRRV